MVMFPKSYVYYIYIYIRVCVCVCAIIYIYIYRWIYMCACVSLHLLQFSVCLPEGKFTFRPCQIGIFAVDLLRCQRRPSQKWWHQTGCQWMFIIRPLWADGYLAECGNFALDYCDFWWRISVKKILGKLLSASIVAGKSSENWYSNGNRMIISDQAPTNWSKISKGGFPTWMSTNIQLKG